jgi:prepilin-type N-terminal cleavage/methylation domain-containing protein
MSTLHFRQYRERAPQVARRRGSGFTLIELLITVAVLLVVIVGVLALFEMGTKVSQVQTNVADLQQGVRIAQYDVVRAVRVAGRGGLERGSVPQGVALEVRNNVPPAGGEHFIAVGDAASDPVVAGTDVLTVRGVFGTIFQVEPTPGNLVLVDDGGVPPAIVSGTLRIKNPHPTTGVAQDLVALIDALEDHPGESFLLVSPLDVYATVIVDNASSDFSDPADPLIAFTVGGTNPLLSTGGGFSSVLRSVAYAGILEEHRYYIKEGRAIAGDATSPVRPVLTRARFQPGTEVAHPAMTGWGDDIADNVFDLQLALGLNRNPGPAGDDIVTELPGGGDDEWLLNHENDDPTDDPKWNGDLLAVPPGVAPPLYYVRVTTAARTGGRDPRYQAPLLGIVEDKDYADAPYSFFNTKDQREYRRRMLQTVVDLRNL